MTVTTCPTHFGTWISAIPRRAQIFVWIRIPTRILSIWGLIFHILKTIRVTCVIFNGHGTGTEYSNRPRPAIFIRHLVSITGFEWLLVSNARAIPISTDSTHRPKNCTDSTKRILRGNTARPTIVEIWFHYYLVHHLFARWFY